MHLMADFYLQLYTYFSTRSKKNSNKREIRITFVLKEICLKMIRFLT